MDIKVKLEITNKKEEQFFGAGPLWLLRQIAEHGSISQAAQAMELSYVKALKLLNRLEENVNRRVITRARGGHERGGAQLTPYGRQLVAVYTAYEEKVKEFARREFKQLRDDLAAAPPAETILVITAFSTYWVMKICKSMAAAGLPAALIPTPRELSSDCGQSVEVSAATGIEVIEILTGQEMEYDAVYRKAGKKYHRLLPAGEKEGRKC